MSWGKLFGDLAKDLTKEYLRDRGAKGAMEDLGSLANGVKGFFSGNNDSSEDSDIWDDYNELVEQGEYQAAIDNVKSIYNGIDKDYLYHYFIGNAMVFLALEEGDLKQAYTARNHLQSARNTCPEGTEDYELIKERISETDDSIKTIRRAEELKTNWVKTLDKVHKLSHKNEFEKAAKALIDHYKQYENGELDYFYWIEMAEIHYEAHKKGISPNADKEYDLFIEALNKASRDADDADTIDRINRMRRWERKESKNIVKSTAPAADIEDQTKAEKEYMEEVKACLADDGIISERERRLLNKLRKSLGISEERAMQLEKECQNNGLNEQELVYLEELKACMEDGVITEKEERLLNRLRKTLGISEERDAEIRKMVKE